jgi:hypothetical protein
MASRGMNLAQTTNRNRFVTMLEKAEEGARFLTDWEQTFVRDMRTSFNSREDAEDLGQTPWSPTMNQWNTLHGIVSTL